ncbi:methionyl-tRNA formyltransferase [Clostridium butanoliproducens]|uniref:methionyl-tRNA formyltransferase n=1 Tax=Clostridium butanoliproducens TaxID=2991837 RepID=UPI0024BB5471|nr:methionyl-tRNA formyltransferase [Clostridium butanoliproducens]
MKIVFMGTPDFAVPSLKALINKFEVMAVFTQPDRPKGRGKALAMSPVKEVALEHNIPVYQPENLRKEPEIIDMLKKMEPDFIIVVAFGQILSKEVLDIAKYGCINLHASLLPKFRGAAPINYAIMAGEKKSGNTTMLMDVGLDTGDMLLKNEVEIDENMTFGELHDVLMNSGSDLLVETIKKLSKGEITGEKQDDSKSCYAHKLNKEMAAIDWDKSSREIHNFVRGLNPFPIAYTFYGDKMMKVISTKLLQEESNKKPGTILKVNKEGIRVATKDKVILITKIQFPNKKPLEVSEYIKGNVIEENVELKSKNK